MPFCSKYVQEVSKVRRGRSLNVATCLSPLPMQSTPQTGAPESLNAIDACRSYGIVCSIPIAPPFTLPFRHLFDGAPHLLQETGLLCQPVQRVVCLAHRPYEAAESEGGVVAGDGASISRDVGDGDLDGAVVIGADEAVGCAALARDVAMQILDMEGLKMPRLSYRSTSSPLSFSIVSDLGCYKRLRANLVTATTLRIFVLT